MTVARKAAAALVAAGMAGSALAAARGPAAEGGFYTAQQASDGAALYAERCAACHGPALEGTWEIPALTGKFVANWAGRPVGDLKAYVARAMPQFAPGSLAPDETDRIVAYLLSANGWPSGATPLGSGATLDRRLPAPGPRGMAAAAAAKPGEL
jgi:mono/diheme cytochrome c family protein